MIFFTVLIMVLRFNDSIEATATATLKTLFYLVLAYGNAIYVKQKTISGMDDEKNTDVHKVAKLLRVN